MTNGAKILGMVGAVLFVSVILAIVLALPIMLCWNYVMPAVFGLPKLTFMQALVMNILSALLIKSGASTSSK